MNKNYELHIREYIPLAFLKAEAKNELSKQQYSSALYYWFKTYQLALALAWTNEREEHSLKMPFLAYVQYRYDADEAPLRSLNCTQEGYDSNRRTNKQIQAANKYLQNQKNKFRDLFHKEEIENV